VLTQLPAPYKGAALPMSYRRKKCIGYTAWLFDVERLLRHIKADFIGTENSYLILVIASLSDPSRTTTDVFNFQ